MAVVDVVGLGESSIDYVYVLSRLPDAGTSKIPIRSHFSACGGQVATTMAACAALDLRAAYLGPVGNDANGARVRSELESRGVDISRLIVRTADTRYAVILVDERSGDRQVLWERDRRLLLDPTDLENERFADARVLHVDAVDEAASIHAATAARANGLMVTSDIDTVTSRTPELLAAVTVAIVAEHVPSQLTGEGDVEKALRAMRTRHDGLLCVTLGARGAAALDGNDFHHAPAIAIDAVDSTGAGDIFRADIIYGLLQRWNTPRVLQFANTAAAISCTRAGAMASVPSADDVRARM
jgi:sulfofructose kinase